MDYCNCLLEKFKLLEVVFHLFFIILNACLRDLETKVFILSSNGNLLFNSRGVGS